MANPVINTLKRAAQQLRREMKRNKLDVRRAEKRYEKRRIREMVKAARRGVSLTGAIDCPEHTKLKAEQAQGNELKNKLAAIEKLLPASKPRKAAKRK